MLLRNKTSIITGCNKGIGKELIKLFSMNGSNLIACVRKSDAQFESYVSELKKQYKNNIDIVEFDLNNEEDVKNKIKEVISLHNKVDILVNNAAIINTSLFQMTTLSSVKEIFQVNFFSQTIITQYVVKSMIKNKSGSIVYISSTAALDGNYGRSSYASSKSAIIAQAKVLSKEVGEFGVRVNIIAPGLTETEMLKKNTSEKIINEEIKKISLKRLAKPEEIANTALFLTSDLSKYITGQTIRVDGGMS